MMIPSMWSASDRFRFRSRIRSSKVRPESRLFPFSVPFDICVVLVLRVHEVPTEIIALASKMVFYCS